MPLFIGRKNLTAAKKESSSYRSCSSNGSSYMSLSEASSSRPQRKPQAPRKKKQSKEKKPKRSNGPEVTFSVRVRKEGTGGKWKHVDIRGTRINAAISKYFAASKSEDVMEVEYDGTTYHASKREASNLVNVRKA